MRNQPSQPLEDEKHSTLNLHSSEPATVGALKNFGLDWSHFSIQAGLFDAQGIPETSEATIFPNVNIETVVGGMPLKLPILTGAFGSTEVARANWDALAIGAALSGVSVTVGENIAGMDTQATLANGKSPIHQN
jgi:hypothetical protein